MNIGLIGFGFMGKTHTYAINNLGLYYDDAAPDAVVAGVCTSKKETATDAARRYRIPLATTDEDALITSPDIDVIDVCTPNSLHYSTVKKALEHKKHVYCEKPLAVTYAQARELSELAEKQGVVAQVVFNYRFMGGVQRAKQLLDEGRLGRILSFRFSYRHDSCLYPQKPAGWKQDAREGGGVLHDLGSHAVDLCHYLLGEFAEVSGRAQIAFPTRIGRDGSPWQTNAEEAFYMTAALKSGAVGTVEASKLDHGTNDGLSFEIFGERGAITYSLMQPNYLRFYDGERASGELGGERGFTDLECVGRFAAPGGRFPAIKAPTGWLMGHVGSMFAFLDAVQNGKKASPSFDEGAYTQYVLDRAKESDAQRGVFLTV